MEKGTRREVSVHVDATPEQVYAVVSDITRMGEWSPETIRAEWLDGATGPAVGATFKGSNKRGVARWSTKPTVTAADPGREFAFLVEKATLWSYRMEPDGDGTRLVESFEMMKDMPRIYAVVERVVMGVKDRAGDLQQGMQETCERIKAAVERGAT